MQTNDEIEDEIIREAMNGKPAAFEQLVLFYSDRTYGIAFNILRSHEDAQEVVQDVFVKVYRYLNRYRFGGKFSSWLYKITYTSSLNTIRGRRKEELYDAESYQDWQNGIVDSGKWDQIELADQKAYIGKALDRLKADDRLVLSLFYLSEYSIEEIAVQMKWKDSQTKVKLHRARGKMYAELNAMLNQEMMDLL